MERKQTHRGRPTQPPKPGKKSTVSLRLTAEIKAKLDKAAKAADRPFSQEAEIRLERSFDREELMPEVLGLAFGKRLAAILILAARTAASTGLFTGYTERSSENSAAVDSEWPTNSPQLRTLLLALRVINDPKSALAAALLAKEIPRTAIDQEGSTECYSVGVMLRTLLEREGPDDREWQFCREQLINLIEALGETR